MPSRTLRKIVVFVVLAALGGSMLGAGDRRSTAGRRRAAGPGAHQPRPQQAAYQHPLISSGEIWDFEVVGTRVYVAGTFSSLQDPGGATVSQRLLAAFNINTGQVDTAFRATFAGGGVNAVEASPDGSKLYVAGSFNTVNGVARRKIASINPTTGATVAGFTANASAAATALAATNTTLYVGGPKTVNGAARAGLVGVNGTTGAVITGFNNSISGGIGVNGLLTVQQLKLTHDDSNLLVVHTGRKIANQDRYGVGLISTQTNQLLPWRTRLWDDNLQFRGGVGRPEHRRHLHLPVELR